MRQQPRSSMPVPAYPDDSTPRVLHVVDSLERGGLERVVTDLAVMQRQQGYDVAVFSIKVPGKTRSIVTDLPTQ